MNMSRPPTSSPVEEFMLLIVGCVAAAALLGSAGLFWANGVAWLVEHQVLVAAANHPLVAVPGCAGAGLDGSRLAITAAIMLAVLAWVVSAFWRWLAARGRPE